MAAVIGAEDLGVTNEAEEPIEVGVPPGLEARHKIRHNDVNSRAGANYLTLRRGGKWFGMKGMGENENS